MDMIEKLAAAGKLTPEQVARVRKTVYEFMKTAHDDPAFHREAMEKLAVNWGQLGTEVGKNVVSGVALAGALGVISAGVGAGQEAIKSFTRKKDVREGFDTMLAANPTLKGGDKGRMKAIYSTLHNFNPDYAKDPLVAGTFVDNAMAQERVDVGTINSVVEAQSKIRQGKQPGPDFLGHMGAISGIAKNLQK
jgi:hypothetical protein